MHETKRLAQLNSLHQWHPSSHINAMECILECWKAQGSALKHRLKYLRDKICRLSGLLSKSSASTGKHMHINRN